MIQTICSECASTLDLNSYQLGSSIELRLSPCCCITSRIEELEEANYNLSNEVELLKLKLYNIEHHLSH